ncbi:MAG: DUF4082 domain-containing protein, partial [Chloroflexales bacterium]|nr:DUF4082 domain-containing protein [Chloroflexales bacterium]
MGRYTKIVSGFTACLIIVIGWVEFAVSFALPASGAQIAPSNITALAYSPDDAVIVAGTSDGRIIEWQASDGRNRRAWETHAGQSVSGLAYHPDGNILASAGHDSTVRVWNVATGQEVQLLTGHEHPVKQLAFSPDGSILASVAEDTRVVLWDANTGDIRNILRGHINTITDTAFSADSQTLATAGADGRIIIWDLATGKEQQVLLGHDGAVTAIAFARNGRLLVSVGEDATVRVWNVNQGRQIRVLTEHRRGLRALDLSPDGRLMVTGGEERRIFVWGAATNRKLRELQGHSGAVNTLAFSPNSAFIASGAEDGQVIIWRAADGQPALVLQAPEPPASTNPPNSSERAQPLADNAGVDTAARSAQLAQGPGGPILVVTSTAASNPYGDYYAEILRNEGLNAFATTDVSALSAEILASYDVVLLSEMSLSADQTTLLTDWVNSGGNLIAMRPDKRLAGLLGLTDAGGAIAGGYLLIDTTSAAGNGLVAETIQYHGSADRYNLNGAVQIATLYSDAATATSLPAVTVNTVGVNGGQAAAFTYDLARSVVYARQGNQAWAGQERDDRTPIRSDDLYFGAAPNDPQPDWVNLDKAAIPQADEQQRLLANLVLQLNSDRKPLPRFWYFPRGEKAVIVMTGDDHANGGTAGRFDQYLAQSAPGCSVEDWECIRGTSYIFTNTSLSNDQAAQYDAAGFEIALHVNTDCADFTPASLSDDYSTQIAAWQAKYTSLDGPVTHRVHCLVWSDWDSQINVQFANGIRFDTNYYYWPGEWVRDRPGFFTGSGLPMRFTDASGALVDIYQATSQMTDESGQSYPFTVEALLDRALGAEGYYGAFVVNAHTDFNPSAISDETVAAAVERGVPVVTARQMLTWLDGRNNSSFNAITWTNDTLTFDITPASGARGLQAMLPMAAGGRQLSGITRNGSPAPFSVEAIKGTEYAIFDAASGAYAAQYASDQTAPTITGRNPVDGATNVELAANVEAIFDEAIDPTTVNEATFELRDASNTLVPATITYSAATRTATLNPETNLAPLTAYSVLVRGGASGSAVTDVAGNPLAADERWIFTSVEAPQCPCTIWDASTTPQRVSADDPNAVEIGVKFQSELDGFITGIRFYKGSSNTGPHTANLWTLDGTLLVSADFTNETASGWQQVNFASPVPVTAGSVYVASYYTQSGFYASDLDYFASAGVVNSPLKALRDGESGGNGVYKYGDSGFPTNTYRSSNYWVDVVFDLDSASAPTPTASNTPTASSTPVGPTATPTSTPTPTNTPTPLPSGTTYSIWDAGTTPGLANDPNTNPIEVGVKLRTSVDGVINGIRFYKGPLNTGTHTGSLWTSSGDLLAQATFTNETASGWQEVSFAEPAPVTANTTYIASYFAPNGRYALDQNFFTSAVVNGPLTALADGTDGGNGVYLEGSSGFPINAFQSSNYWVDVIFTTDEFTADDPCTTPANPIVAENCLAGNPQSEWDVSGIGDPSIQGFATEMSVNRGETISFKIDTDAADYRIDIYRLGYYGGEGARKVATIPNTATVSQSQPACLSESSTGLIDCGNWSVSASWNVPSDATSGIYIARPVRTDTNGASHIVFIVRDDAGTSNILFQTSDTTWQAYNTYGGNSLYIGGPGSAPSRAYKVSYNRPFNTRSVDNGQDYLFSTEYPMLRWLEANGYDVSYFTGVDSDRRGDLIQNHKIFLSIGHDEYWSGAQRGNVEAARDAGVHMAFFSGNEVYWKTRWEDSIDGSGTVYRTLVTYKESHNDAKIDPAAEWTGLWRDPRFSPPSDGGRPENALTGQIFGVNAGATTAIQVPAEDGKMRFWRNTSIATLPAGGAATLADDTLGYEWDVLELDSSNPAAEIVAAARPAGLIRLSTTTVDNAPLLRDYGSNGYQNSFSPLSTASHHLTLYRHSSGALVFGAGTVQWSWGLDDTHDRNTPAPDSRMRQATVNLFADMGVQPATLQSGLVLANASTDATPPTSTITSPADGSTVAAGTRLTISGAATDAGGVVGGIEVSVDGGATWSMANGRANWSYIWTPSTEGSATIRSRAVDDSGNIESPSAGVTITVGSGGDPNCPCSIWDASAVPAIITDRETTDIELGVKFRANVAGVIQGIRFY